MWVVIPLLLLILLNTVNTEPKCPDRWPDAPPKRVISVSPNAEYTSVVKIGDEIYNPKNTTTTIVITPIPIRPQQVIDEHNRKVEQCEIANGEF